MMSARAEMSKAAVPTPSRRARSRRFVKLRLDVLARPDVTASAKLILASIEDRIGDNGYAWPGIRRLARDCGLNPKTVVRGVRKLVDRELLIVERRGNGQSNRYRLPEPTVPQDGALPKVTRSQNATGGAPENGTEAIPFLPQNQTEPLSQTKRGARRKSATPPDPRIGDFLNWFCETYQQAKGIAYVVQGGKDQATVKRLLRSVTPEELQQASQAMLADAWGGERAAIGLLASQINTWRGKRTMKGHAQDDYARGF